MKTFLYLLIPLVIAGCATAPTPEQLAAADYGPRPDNYEDLIKAHYSKVLFDPYSAVFEMYPPLKGWLAGQPGGSPWFGWIVCGTVNAKNRMGGYVGAQPFFAAIKYGQVVTTDTARWGTFGAEQIVVLCQNLGGIFLR